jgi:LmbE family N-acetylglucosaminyl deacetylase
MRIVEFDHRDVGTPEAYWSPLLADLPRIDPCSVSGPVVVVSPHPDDEVLAAGGTVQRLVLAGAAVTVISLTDGEAADPGDPSLGDIRRAELRSAVDRLALASIEVVRIGLGDGRLASMPPEHLLASIERAGGPAATWIAPLPDDGHPDHDAAGRAAMTVAGRTGARLWQYAVWAWHWGRDVDLPLARAVRVDLDDLVLARKRHAIDEFRSQTTGEDAILNVHVRSRFERPFEVFFT